MTGGTGAPPTWRGGSQWGVYYTPLPQVVDIVQGHDVGHQSGPVAFVVELQVDLRRGGPALGPKCHGLCKVLYGRRHCGLLQVPQLPRVSMGVVHQ